MMASSIAAAVVPAQLGFLAIYNPSLGTTDDTIDDQIVYYASVTTQNQRRRHRSRSRPTQNVSPQERNERLRQIGLAQGMVEFSKSFSGDSPVDTIETEKSRVILHELEPGWWILASIDLTRLPASATPSFQSSAKGGGDGSGSSSSSGGIEYSSREVKPTALLLQDLLRAHSIFLLHHDSSLSAMFVRSKRSKFVAILGRYWDLFLSSWSVLLHGNPMRGVFGGIKVAACGELGIGVGEEERGSGEREVLEGLVGRIEGLVDLVVSKFGSYDGDTSPRSVEGGGGSGGSPGDDPEEKWLGTGNEPGGEDGAIFLGVGALSKHSLRDVTFWMEDLYTWGDEAYGVSESPTSTRQVRRPKKPPAEPPMKPPTPVTELARRAKQQQQQQQQTTAPPEAAAAAAATPTNAPKNPEPAAAATKKPSDGGDPGRGSTTAVAEGEGGGGGGSGTMDKYVHYLKLGYGKYWSLGGSAAGEATGGGGGDATSPRERPGRHESNRRQSQVVDDASGHYLIGLKGDVEDSESDVEDSRFADIYQEEGEHNSRTLLRTVTVELESEGRARNESQITKDLGSQDNELQQQRQREGDEDGEGVGVVVTVDEEGNQVKQGGRGGLGGGQRASTFDSQDRNKTKKLRVVVYVNKPFIFTFLFHLRTDSLAWDAQYKSLHHQLSPLRRPLAHSTAYRPAKPDVVGGGSSSAAPTATAASIYDLIWDPKALTVHSTLPNIPVAGSGGGSLKAGAAGAAGAAGDEQWSRVEALNTHMQMLNMYTATRADLSELERTCKTSRGWWIVWSRILERETRLAEPRPRPSSSSSSSLSGSGGASDDEDDDEITPTQDYTVSKEIFLIRKASDHGGGASGVRSLSASYVSGGSWADGASRLAQGIGVDTRKYIEDLLSLSR